MAAPDTTRLVDAATIRSSVSGLTDTGKFPAPVLERFCRRFEDLCVTHLGFSPVPRTATETLYPTYGRLPLLARPRVTSIVSIDYSSGGAPDPGDVGIDGRCLTLKSGAAWPRGIAVTVVYVHGCDPDDPTNLVPAALIDGCIEFVRAEALQQVGSQPRNVTGERTDFGWIPEPTADPSKGRYTRWTVVNEAMNQVPSEHPVQVA